MGGQGYSAAPMVETTAKELLSDKRLRGLLLAFFILVLLRNAWVCEDAFITMRVVENAVHGLGLRWNPLERVQVYTHPLWMFLLIPARIIGRQALGAAMGLGIVCSIAAMGVVLFRGISSVWSAVLAVLVLTLSKAFMDFSTGGLENPLSHLLLALFFFEYFRPRPARRLWRLFFFAALGACNRLDLAIFFFVPLLQVLWEERPERRTFLRATFWLWPIVLWEVFSVLYYGFPFPNSYYAKLATSLPRSALFAQGFYYLLNSLSWDPLTLFATGSLVAMSATRRGDQRAHCLAVSVLLYLAYTISVGGDYMTGRFLTTPLFVAVLGLARLDLTPGRELYVSLALVSLVGMTAPRPPVLSSDKYENLGKSAMDVDDERGYRHGDTSLLLRNKNHGLASGGYWIKDGVEAGKRGDRVVVYKNIGYFGFFAGPGVHVIDPYGIGDPLMPRLPWVGGDWGTGHFFRHVPDGYTEAAIDNGTINDPEVEAYWQKLKRVTRDPVFDGARLREVLRFNLGQNPPRLPDSKK